MAAKWLFVCASLEGGIAPGRMCTDFASPPQDGGWLEECRGLLRSPAGVNSLATGWWLAEGLGCSWFYVISDTPRHPDHLQTLWRGSSLPLGCAAVAKPAGAVWLEESRVLLRSRAGVNSLATGWWLAEGLGCGWFYVITVTARHSSACTPRGEGACSRSAAQQSQNRRVRCGWKNAGGCFAAQRERAPSPRDFGWMEECLGPLRSPAGRCDDSISSLATWAVQGERGRCCVREWRGEGRR